MDEHGLGVVAGADAPHRILLDQVRYPDVAFLSYAKLTKTEGPHPKVPNWVPSLAIEILSESNTRAEMTRKLADYFEAGVELVWYVDPPTRTVKVFTSPNDSQTYGEDDLLNGGNVLPGFQLSIREWFDKA